MLFNRCITTNLKNLVFLLLLVRECSFVTVEKKDADLATKHEYEEWVAGKLSETKLCAQARSSLKYVLRRFREDVYYFSGEYVEFVSAASPTPEEINTSIINWVCAYRIYAKTINIDSIYNDYTIRAKIEGTTKIHLDDAIPRKTYHAIRVHRQMKFTVPDAFLSVLEHHKVAVHQKGSFPGSIENLQLVAIAESGVRLYAKYNSSGCICYAVFSIILSEDVKVTETS